VDISQKELEPYNPVAKESLAAGIVARLRSSLGHPFPPSKRFEGAGVYLLYYIGKSQFYLGLAPGQPRSRAPVPIYVGKADPKGTRKGSRLDAKPGSAVYDRLGDHAERIKATKNLKLKDFYFRFVILDHVWIRLGEAGLIDHFRPLWNTVVDGFGSKIPGRNRRKQARSAWDTLHPGKGWPEDLSAGRHTIRLLQQRIDEHCLATARGP